MANTTKTKSELKMEFKFADNDTRTISLDNPRSGLTKEDILGVVPKAVGVIIGDKAGAAAVGINTAFVSRQTITTLDIGNVAWT